MRQWAVRAAALACVGLIGAGCLRSTTAGGGDASAPEPVQVGPSRPNILIIYTDDQRADTLDVMPAVRRWFESGGTRFPNGFVTTPLCCPSRSSILSGRYVHNHGVHNNQESENLDHRWTVERYLHDAGYTTAIVGKFLNGWDLSQDPPYFDTWAVMQRGYTDVRFNVDGEQRVVETYATDFLAHRAVADLRAFELDDTRPWLLFFTPYAPHAPWTPEPAYADAPVGPWGGNPATRERNLSDKPPFVQDQPHLSTEEVAGNRRGQLRSLMSVDDAVARLMRLLGELEERTNTLAFFLSDNGFLWGEHGIAGTETNARRDPPTIAGKRFPYTPSIAVPFLVRWPSHVAADAVDRRLVANVDIAPTVLDAAGLTAPSNPPMDGRSLLDADVRDRLLLEYFRDPVYPAVPTWASTRTRGFQYIEWYDADGRVLFREYYDLHRDPWQLRNLLEDERSGNDPPVAALASELHADRGCRGLRDPIACP